MFGRNELRVELLRLKPREIFVIRHDDFDIIFPPGIPDQKAMRIAGEFAHACDCEVKNIEKKREVSFTKKTTAKIILKGSIGGQGTDALPHEFFVEESSAKNRACELEHFPIDFTHSLRA